MGRSLKNVVGFVGMRRRPGGSAVAWAVAAACCVGGPIDGTRGDQGGRKARPEERPSTQAAAEVLPRGWSIVLEVHSGAESREHAQRRLAEVSAACGRGDVYLRPTARGTAIVAGSFADPGSAEAREAIQAVRGRVVGGDRLFAEAFFAPPREAVDPGRTPELNLLSARRAFGPEAQYTLQIAFYQSKKPDEAKRAAEEAAVRLRRDGELAFYYHGPTMSLVTVGVFRDRDFDQRLRPKNPTLLALTERYPLNLHNGEYPVLVREGGGEAVKQPSQLVRIPDG